jgi:hypothetical protein
MLPKTWQLHWPVPTRKLLEPIRTTSEVLTIYTSITMGMVGEFRRIGVTPHVAQNTARLGGSAIDGRTTRHEGYAKSINARCGIEKVFGWIKQWGGLCQFKVRGTGKVSAVFGLHVIAYNLIRLGNLLNPAMAAA